MAWPDLTLRLPRFAVRMRVMTAWVSRFGSPIVLRIVFLIAVLAGGASVVRGAGAPELDVLRVESALEKAVRVGHAGREDTRFTPFSTRIDGQEQITVVSVRYDDDGGFLLDLYYPPSVDLDQPAQQPLPVILIPQGFRAATMESYGLGTPMEQPFMMGWGMFFAMQGTVCVLYDAQDLAAGFTRMIEFLDRHADALGLDLERLGVFGTSGHGALADRETGHELVRDRLDAAVYVHGDQRGLMLNRTQAEYLVVYTEDGSEWNRYGAAFAMRATMRGHAVTEIRDAPHKNFFLDDRSERTHEIMTEIGEFVVRTLGSTPAHQ